MRGKGSYFRALTFTTPLGREDAEKEFAVSLTLFSRVVSCPLKRRNLSLRMPVEPMSALKPNPDHLIEAII